ARRPARAQRRHRRHRARGAALSLPAPGAGGRPRPLSERGACLLGTGGAGQHGSLALRRAAAPSADGRTHARLRRPCRGGQSGDRVVQDAPGRGSRPGESRLRASLAARGRGDMFEVRIPSLGESVTEAEIARWAKADGDTVKQDEVLLELESDKASMELPAERSGVLRIVKQAGEKVAVGDLVARIEDGPGAPAAAPPKPRPEVPAPATGHVPSPPPPPAPAPAPAPAAEAPPPPSPPQAASRAVGPLSPAVRNLIEEHGLDPTAITASGRGGRLTKGDV